MSRTYRVNEIFYSIQGEGKYAGTPAVFVRFSGCNLKCPFCDTQHSSYEAMDAKAINDTIDKLIGLKKEIIVVFTGGEPTLQISEDEPLAKGYKTHIETNGLLPVPSWVDWVTVSPKTKLNERQIEKADEIKILYGIFDDEYIKSLPEDKSILIQPLEESGKTNVKEAMEFVKENPRFKLGVQLHKILGIR